jgi:hypothetical protein
VLETSDVWLMVFNATFNNMSVISWQSVSLVKETGVRIRVSKSDDLLFSSAFLILTSLLRDSRDHDRMVVGFTTTCAIR